MFLLGSSLKFVIDEILSARAKRSEGSWLGSVSPCSCYSLGHLQKVRLLYKFKTKCIR